MLSKIFSIAAVLAFSVQAATAASCARNYTVKAGDYCDKISAANNASTYQLAAVNTGVDRKCSNLKVGDSLCLGNTGEDCQTVYVVKSGDTCTGIASAAGVNTTILYLNNPQIDKECKNIYVGEVLCTATSVKAPPIPSSGAVVPVSGPPANPQPAANSSSTATAITVAATTTPPPAVNAAPIPSVTQPAPAPSSSAASSDDDLPYCDEI